ncbi:MAG: hypothetical protein IJ838_05395, partial [Paludibacteraceae bacterium]|nr:hypothetical protein [Paludibacteraceae bacterium]
NAVGCDSICTLHLTINHPTTSDTTAVECTSFVWHGTEYTTSGDYDWTTTNVAGCDSTRTLHLTINHPTTSDTTAVECTSFTWHGTEYTSSGDYDWTTTNVAGCDSIRTLHLTINHSTTSDTTAVECTSFTWHGTTYTSSGDYDWTTTNVAGCDSVRTLHLTINQSTTSDTTAVECTSFTWHGTEYTTSGDYDWTTTNVAGCDSVRTLHLTINQPTTSDTMAVECTSFTWHGTEYTTSGDYDWTTTNAAGCDSTRTLHLTINHPTTSDTTAVECTSFTWHGTEYTTSGDYDWTTTNVAGCDSIRTLHLTILGSSIEMRFEMGSICSESPADPIHLDGDGAGGGDPQDANAPVHRAASTGYVWTGHEHLGTLTEADTYRDTIRSVLTGCDSVICTLQLSMDYPTVSDTTAIECTSFTWHGTEYTTSGDYDWTTTNVAGCDSIRTLHLTINHPTTSDTTAVECTAFTWHGTTYTTSGDYDWTTTNVPGCDSIRTLHLTINQPTTSDTTAVECTSFTWHETEYTTSGDYPITLTNANGCDSTRTLHLTINQPTTSDTTAVECSAFTWHGTEYTSSGDYDWTTTNVAGCDSIRTLHLTITQPTTSDTTAIECTSFTWHGTEYTSSGDYEWTTTNAAGCDSVRTLHLTINQPTVSDTTAIECTSFTWHGTEYTASGDYDWTTTNAAGCDSIRTLHLTINQPTTSDTTAVECTSFTWHGTEYTSSGDYPITLTNINGCDSIRTLHLTINQPTIGDTTATAQESFVWYGTTYTASGDYMHTLTNRMGCDSLLTLHLTIVSTTCGIAIVAPETQLCQLGTMQLTTDHEADYYLWRGTNLTDTIARNPSVTFTTVGQYRYTLDAMYEYGSNLIYNGDFELGNTGFVTDYTLQSSAKISMGEYNVVSTPQAANTNFSNCDDHGQILVVDGDITDGNLRVFSTEVDVEPDTYYAFSCYVTNIFDRPNSRGDLPTLADLQFYIAGETFSEVFQPEWTTCEWKQIYKVWYSGTNTHITISLLNHCAIAYGNDFAVDNLTFRPLCVAHDEINISVNLPTEKEESVTANDSYTWHGTTYTASGDYTWTTTNTAGCDSTETLHLTIHSTQPTYGDTTAMECGSFSWYGRTYTQSGTYTHTIANGNSMGNDSIVTLHLTLVQTTYQRKTDNMCDTELPYQWTTYRTQTIMEAGNYSDTLFSRKGCDSIIYILDLTVQSESMVVTPSITAETCADDESLFITLTTVSGAPTTYDLTFDAQAVAQGFNNLIGEPVPASGIITVAIPQGADSTQYVRPDDYNVTLTLHDDCEHLADYPLSFRLLYPSWLIQQRWRDVLALYNQNYNGGYTFSDIRWYMNGTEVLGQGEQHSYIYMTPNLNAAVYYALLTRSDDGKIIRTCDVVPNLNTPYYIPSGDKIRLRAVQPNDPRHIVVETEYSGDYQVYDVTGKELMTGKYGPVYGSPQIVFGPTYTGGTYLIRFMKEGEKDEVKKWLLF